MTIIDRPRLLLVTFIILFASLVGGVIGNWLFIYFLDTYYGIPNGNYVAAPSSGNIVIRNPQKNNNVTATIASAVSNAESSLVGIFKRSNFYIPKNKVGQAVIMTSDGWLMTTLPSPTEGVDGFKDYVVIANDKKVYEIDRAVTDTLNNVTFLHLKKASNFPVKDFILAHDIAPGQEIVGIEWKGVVNTGLVSHLSPDVRSSEASPTELAVVGLQAPNLFLFDLGGQIFGFTREQKAFAIDSVQASLNKVLMSGKIKYARLGIYYISLADLPVESGEGAVITLNDKKVAIIKGSPAERAGLQTGDIITAINKTPITASTDIATILKQFKPGETITITFLRKKEVRTIQVKLDEQIVQ